jgi:hypothetical protein
MTRVLMDIYRGKADDVTLLAVHVADSIGPNLKIHWTILEVLLESLSLSLDDKTIF